MVSQGHSPHLTSPHTHSPPTVTLTACIPLWNILHSFCFQHILAARGDPPSREMFGEQTDRLLLFPSSGMRRVNFWCLNANSAGRLTQSIYTQDRKDSVEGCMRIYQFCACISDGIVRLQNATVLSEQQHILLLGPSRLCIWTTSVHLVLNTITTSSLKFLIHQPLTTQNCGCSLHHLSLTLLLVL